MAYRPLLLMLLAFIAGCDGLLLRAPPPPEEDVPKQPTLVDYDPDDADQELPYEDTPGLPIGGTTIIQTPPNYSFNHVDDSDSFRAGTFNAKVWFNSKTNNPQKRFQLFAGPPKSALDTLFQLMTLAGIDILAVQEVYVKSNETAANSNFAVPQAHAGTFKLDKGQVIYSGSSTNSRNELCPVIWNKNIMECTNTGGGLSAGDYRSGGGGRDIHWMHCKIVKPGSNTEFYFGCGHFSPGAHATRNISDLFTNLGDPAKPPTIKRVGHDIFILGLDANSYPTNNRHLAGAWETARRLLNGRIGVPANFDSVHFEEPHYKHGGSKNEGFHAPNATSEVPANEPYSKTYIRKPPPQPCTAKITVNKGKRLVDPLLWRDKPTAVDYIEGSNHIIDVFSIKNNRYNGMANGKTQFQCDFHEFSDHRPEVADFEYD